jgi:ferredoxin-nitrite reductase
MNKDYLQEFLPDLGEFREKTMQFHNGEMSVAEYKGFSGGFGSYAQRGGKKHMLRLRMAGGRLTKERLAFIVDAIEKYEIDMVKLTTCQSVQLHNLEAEDLCELIEPAWRAGMISRGGGGDFPRNVMASPLSGVQADEYFDVLPYAEAMGEYLMQFIKAVKFPRKLKVGFSNSPKNETQMRTEPLMYMQQEDWATVRLSEYG